MTSGILDPVMKLTKDMKNASITLSQDEARFLVDAYYTMQKNRTRSDNQVRALNETAEPHTVLQWLADQSRILENNIKRALDAYSKANPLGEWCHSVKGIGPVIAAGLLAHIDLEIATTAGHIWRFAGLDPTVTWEKKMKRPWNASLKRLCWIIGECFVKTSGYEDGYYGHVWAERKALEIKRNEAGEFAEQAAVKVGKVGKSTDAYKSYKEGKLPPAHIHARAKRYAVKLFLAHYHEMGYKLVLGKEPPLPYPIAILNHSHYIKPPQ